MKYGDGGIMSGKLAYESPRGYLDRPAPPRWWLPDRADSLEHPSGLRNVGGDRFVGAAAKRCRGEPLEIPFESIEADLGIDQPANGCGFPSLVAANQRFDEPGPVGRRMARQLGPFNRLSEIRERLVERREQEIVTDASRLLPSPFQWVRSKARRLRVEDSANHDLAQLRRVEAGAAAR